VPVNAELKLGATGDAELKLGATYYRAIARRYR
jgi:hypothetical protein